MQESVNSSIKIQTVSVCRSFGNLRWRNSTETFSGQCGTFPFTAVLPRNIPSRSRCAVLAVVQRLLGQSRARPVLVVPRHLRIGRAVHADWRPVPMNELLRGGAGRAPTKATDRADAPLLHPAALSTGRHNPTPAHPLLSGLVSVAGQVAASARRCPASPDEFDNLVGKGTCRQQGLKMQF